MSDHDRFEVDQDIVMGQCVLCRHLYPVEFGIGACPAFPGGIPWAVLGNSFDHRKPHPDEAEPVHFEPRADVSREKLEALYDYLDGR